MLEDKIVIFLELNDNDFVLLLQAARKQGMSRTELIRKALGAYLQELMLKEKIAPPPTKLIKLNPDKNLSKRKKEEKEGSKE